MQPIDFRYDGQINPRNVKVPNGSGAEIPYQQLFTLSDPTAVYGGIEIQDSLIGAGTNP